MSAPAVLRRCACGHPEDSCDGTQGDVVVASGPLVIMAHGLMAIDGAERAHFRITSAVGDFTAQDTADLLHMWRTPATRDA